MGCMADRRYDEMYDFHIASINEVPLIMDFIGKNWRPGHILSQDRDFFLYQYGSDCEKDIHMMLACRKQTGELEGILGFIPASEDPGHRDVWGSMWKVREGNMLFLGMEMMNRLLSNLQYRCYLSPGIDMATTGKLVQKRYAWMVGRLRHWYVLRPQPEYKIAVIHKAAGTGLHLQKRTGVCNAQVRSVKTFRELEAVFDFTRFQATCPYKDAFYINKRYYSHPLFDYEVYAVMEHPNQADAFFVTRVASTGHGQAVRLVDFVGDRSKIKGIRLWIQEYLEAKQAEYLDFYEYGFEAGDMKQAGFTERTLGDVNIIPDYFAPFEQKNVEIYFHAPDKNVVICKADGDQDRPN